MNCEICGKPLVNIEHSDSNYETFVCVNRNCVEHEKAQIHRSK